jgi:plasmid stabilization system protein ParE
MATTRQSTAARRNVRKAQAAWRGLSATAHARAQPQGRGRAKPGARGGGAFFHIEVRPRREFKTFRTQDVGKKGGIERVAGKASSGSWNTQKWLISKEHAHRAGRQLVADTADARQVLKTLGAPPRHLSGDRFKAKDRPNVPERKKPTPAMRRARTTNIRKAQAAKRGRR